MTVLAPDDTIPDLTRIIEEAILNHPRTLQQACGPSDIATSCDRCLITRLAGQAPPEYPAWIPTIGTAVHEWLEMTLIQWLAHTGSDRYILEGRVNVGSVGGSDIYGSCDLFDVRSGTVVDYKLVGTTTLRACTKSGIKSAYRRQVHLYGRGWRQAGYDVQSVAVWCLPRNGLVLGQGYLHQEPYNETIALETLARADMFATALAVYGYDEMTRLAPSHNQQEFTCPRDPTETIKKQLEGLMALT